MECGGNGEIGQLVVKIVEVEIKQEFVFVIPQQWHMVEILVLVIRHTLRLQLR